MRRPAEIKADWLRALSDVADPAMARHGFARRKTSVDYVRTVGDAQQYLVMHTDMFPRYEPMAELHVLPKIKLLMPSVSTVALKLVQGDKMLLADAPEIIFNQPMDMTAPKAEFKRWFGLGIVGMRDAVAQVMEFFERWALPLLDELKSPAQLVAAYERKDSRVLRLQHWHVYVAAACLLVGDEDKARHVVQNVFNNAGLRSRFAPVFRELGINQANGAVS